MPDNFSSLNSTGDEWCESPKSVLIGCASITPVAITVVLRPQKESPSQSMRRLAIRRLSLLIREDLRPTRRLVASSLVLVLFRRLSESAKKKELIPRLICFHQSRYRSEKMKLEETQKLSKTMPEDKFCKITNRIVVGW
jgi:hypothetical protein